MNPTKDCRTEQKARETICNALKSLDGDKIIVPVFSESRIRDNEFKEKLTRPNIDAGIRAFTLITNIYGSDGSDFDLYSLLHQYLLDENSRAQINEIIKSKYR